MPFSIQCPSRSCGKGFSVPDATLPAQARCPHCGLVLRLGNVSPGKRGASSIAPKQTLPLEPPRPAAPSKAPAARLPLPAASESPAARSPAATLPLAGATGPAETPAKTYRLPSQPAAGAMPATLGGFRLQRCLGEGAFGRVYLAYDPHLNRPVALKVARPEFLHSPDHVRRFQREARAAANLRHPHIVAVHDAGQDGDHHFIVADFIKGSSLEVRLADLPEGKMLPWREAVQIVRKLAEALEYAHQRGVVHRDVKPANVLLDERGEPALTDFGLASRDEGEGSRSQDGRIMGTPGYMAPEQCAGKPEPASDQYSLGVMLFELLVGHRPFEGSNAVQLLYLQQHQTPPSPCRFQPGLPRDLETICLKCLEKKPAKRYDGCGELAEDLRRWLNGEPIRARRLSLKERVWRWAKKNPALAATGTLAVGALLWVVVAQAISTEKQRRLNADLFRSNQDLIAETAVKEKALDKEKLARKKTWASFYSSQIARAEREFMANNVAKTLRFLEACRPEPGMDDLRNWEWNYWKRQCHSEIRSLPGKAVALSPNGKYLLVQQNQGEFKILDGETWAPLRNIKMENAMKLAKLSRNGTFPVEFSRNGIYLAAVCGPQIKVWETATGEEKCVFPVLHDKNYPAYLAIHPDESRIASADCKGVRIWDLASGREVLSPTWPGARITALAFDPAGKQLAIAGFEKLDGRGQFPIPFGAVLTADTGQFISSFRQVPKTLNYEICSIAFSHDGQYLVTSGKSEDIYVWNCKTGNTVRIYDGHHDLGGLFAVFHPKEYTVVSCGEFDGTIQAWTPRTGTIVKTIRGHTRGVHRVWFYPDGNRILSQGSDGIKLWDYSRDQGKLTIQPFGAFITNLTFSPDGEQLAVCGREGTVLMNPWTGKPIHRLSGSSDATSVAFSPNGKHLATGDKGKSLKIWEASTVKLLKEIGGHGTFVESVVYCPLGKRLACLADKKIIVRDGVSGELLVEFPASPRDSTIAFSSDGRRIASASTNNTVKVWDVETRQELLSLPGHNGMTCCVAFSSDHRYLATSISRLGGLSEVKLWDAASGKELATFSHGKEYVYGLTFTPDSKRLVSGSLQSIFFWDVENRQICFTLRPDSPIDDAGTVHFLLGNLALSPDGHRLAVISTGKYRHVSIWDARPVE